MGRNGCWSAGTVTGCIIAMMCISALVVMGVLLGRDHDQLPATTTTTTKRDARTTLAVVVEEPMIQTAMCNGPASPNCTRWDMWSKCFIPLVDVRPKDGFITRAEVELFMKNHLYFYERWAAPSPEQIASDCDYPVVAKGPNWKKPNGRVNWTIFNGSRAPGCLGRASDICYAKGACERELEKLHLPPVTVVKKGK